MMLIIRNLNLNSAPPWTYLNNRGKTWGIDDFPVNK